jgi:hypothetical protein
MAVSFLVIAGLLLSTQPAAAQTTGPRIVDKFDPAVVQPVQPVNPLGPIRQTLDPNRARLYVQPGIGSGINLAAAYYPPNEQLEAFFVDSRGAINVMWKAQGGRWRPAVALTEAGFAPAGAPLAVVYQPLNEPARGLRGRHRRRRARYLEGAQLQLASAVHAN